MFDIELIEVTKSYHGSLEPVVNRSNLQVYKGEIITLLGPSGCGKTTTLRLIAGFERPEGGQISLRDTVVSSETGIWVPPQNRGVGIVFQDYALFPHITVEENIAFGLKKSVYKKDRTQKIISLVGLKGYEKRYPHELSGGQQQRVALARALAPRPVVILLDEPFSNLDSQLRKYMRQEIRDIIKSEGTTAIFVTHDQKEAFEISDKIIVMNNGKIEQTGSPKDVYLRPKNEFVANFLGKANIIRGKVNHESVSIESEIGKISYEDLGSLHGEVEIKILIRPQGFGLHPTGEIKGTIKKLIFKGEILEGIVDIESANELNKEITVYFHAYEKVKIGDYISLKIMPDSIVIIR